MSVRGVEFFENWIQQNVTDANKNGSRERAKELAAQCVAEAAVFEISLDDLEPKWGSVESIIYEAMQHREEPGTPGDRNCVAQGKIELALLCLVVPILTEITSSTSFTPVGINS